MSKFYWLPAVYNVKSFNKHAAVDLIRFSTSGLSRSELTDQMDITRAAVSMIINDAELGALGEWAYGAGRGEKNIAYIKVGDIITVTICQTVRERAMRASERSGWIVTGMLGRRSLLIGATIQAINVAIHNAAENKNPASKEISLEINHVEEIKQS